MKFKGIHVGYYMVNVDDYVVGVLRNNLLHTVQSFEYVLSASFPASSCFVCYSTMSRRNWRSTGEAFNA